MSEFPENGTDPDFEKLAASVLRPLVPSDDHIGNFLVVDYDQIQPMLEGEDQPEDPAYITIRKRGHNRDVDDFTITANIEVSCWGKTRSTAQDTGREAIKLLLQHDGGSEIDGVLIDTVEDMTGSEEVIETDDRRDVQLVAIGARPIYED